MPAESARNAGEISKALELSHSSTMLTGGQLVVPFRVRLLGRVSFWPHQLVWSSAELTTGEISLAFGHAMEVRLTCRLQSSVPPFTPYNACLLLVIVGVFKALLARNCNIKRNILSTACNYTHVISHIFMYLHVRWVDNVCHVNVVHVLYTCVILQSLWLVLYKLKP